MLNIVSPRFSEDSLPSIGFISADELVVAGSTLLNIQLYFIREDKLRIRYCNFTDVGQHIKLTVACYFFGHDFECQGILRRLFQGNLVAHCFSMLEVNRCACDKYTHQPNTKYPEP